MTTKAKSNGSSEKTAKEANLALVAGLKSPTAVPTESMQMESVQIPVDELPVMDMLYRKLVDAKCAHSDASIAFEQARNRYMQAAQAAQQNNDIYIQKLTQVGEALKLNPQINWGVNLKDGVFFATPRG